MFDCTRAAAVFLMF